MRRVIAVASVAIVAFAAWGCSDRLVDAPVDPQMAKGGAPGKPPPEELVITGFRVEGMTISSALPFSYDEDTQAAVDQYEADEGLAGDFFGCPDIDRTCNKITMEFEGSLVQFRFFVAHDAGGLFYEDQLETPRLAANWNQRATPILPMTGKASPLEVYWQGQRALYSHYDAEAQEYFYQWSLMPDQDVVGDPDRFVFGCSFATPSKSLMCGGGKFAGFPEGWALFQGEDTGERAYVVMDQISLVTEGGSTRPKKKAPPPSTSLYFELQAFTGSEPFDAVPDYFDSDVLAASVPTSFRPVMTGPTGWSGVVLSSSSGNDPDSPTKPGIEKQTFRFGSFTDGGCYVLSLLGAFVHDVDRPNVVWNRADDTGGLVPPIWINYVATQPSASTWGWGAACPSGD